MAALFLLASAFGAESAFAAAFMVPRYGQAVALLTNGKIMVVGGADTSDVSLNSVEILDITKGSEYVSPAQGFIDNPMTFARSSATITVLPNGKVLVTGGWDSVNNVVRGDAEVYTPNASGGAGSWSAPIAMPGGPRYNHTATLLLTGKVLVCGGQIDRGTPANVTAACDIFDPSTNLFAADSPMLLGRSLHTATILNDGTVWVAGGWNDSAANSNPPFVVTTERYTPNPAGAGTWQQAQPLNVSRAYHTATLTGDNKVLIAGGYNGRGDNPFKLVFADIPGLDFVEYIPSQGVLSSSELFDPTGGSIIPGPPIQARVEAHAAALLPHGVVSIYGGRGNIEPLNITSFIPSPIFTVGSTLDGAFSQFTTTQAVENIVSGNGRLTGTGGVPLTFHLSIPVTGSIIDGDVEFIEPVIILAGTPPSQVVLDSNFNNPAVGLRMNLNGTQVTCEAITNVCGFVSTASIALQNLNTGTFSLTIPVAGATTLPNQGVSGNLNISPTVTGLTINSGVASVVSSGNPLNPLDINNSSFTTHLQIAVPPYLAGKTLSNITLNLTPTQTAGWTEKSSYTVVLNGGSGFSAGPFTVNTVANVSFIDIPAFTFNNCTGSLFVVASDPQYTIPLPGQGDNANGQAPFHVPLLNALPAPGLTGAAVLDNASFSMAFSASGLDISNQSLVFKSANIIIRDMIFGDNQYFSPNVNQWSFAPPNSVVTRPGLTRVGASSLVTPSGTEFDIGGRDCTGGCAGLVAASSPTVGIRLDNASAWTPTRTIASTVNDPLIHAYHTATLLTDGTILLAGGTNGSTVLPNAEIFDPVSGTFSPTTTPLRVARQQHSASLMPNGRVLVAGGFAATSVSTGPTNAAEIYYPDTRIFFPAPPMISSHSQHTAITLPNGNVFVAGGYKGLNTVTGSAEIYSSTSVAWAAVPDMTTAVGGTGALEKRAIAAGVQLQDGRIMLCGGTNESGILSSVVAYDPALNTWSALTSMPTPLQGHTATLLFDGRVLVAGGDDGFGATKSSFIYDPYNGVGGTWSFANPLETARIGHSATLLPNGTVLVSGGVKSNLLSGTAANAVQSMEFYIPDFADWEDGSTPDGTTGEDTPTYLLALGPRAFHTATLAPNGKIYFLGGANGSIGAGQSTSFYTLFESMYFTISPDVDSINQPSLRQSTIAATTSSPFLPGSAFNVTGLRFRGATEAAGGSGPANASFSTPRLMLQKVDGSSGGGSNSTPGFVVDLTTRIYANPANQATLNTSLTVTLPNNNQLPYGWYNAWVGAIDIHTAQSPFVQVGPPKPAAAVTLQNPFVQGTSSVTFSWTGLPLPCDGYNVYSATTGVFITTIAYNGTGIGGTSFTQTNLAPNTTDSIIVAGYTITGDGPVQASATTYTLAAPPTGLQISSVTFNSLALQWSPAGNSAGTIYEVTQSTDWPAPFSQSISTPVPYLFGVISTNVVITQLLPNTTYTYRIQAYNFNRIPSDYSVVATTQTRSPVVGLQGKALSSTSIIWSWNPSGGVTYNVYNATTGVVLFSTTSTSFTDAGLAVNASRVIAVTAVTGAGEGPLSNSATVFTLANVPVPLNPAVTSLSTYSFVEGWSPSDGNPLSTKYHVVLFEYLDNVVNVTTITPIGYGVDTLAIPMSLTPGVRYDSYITAINGDAVPSAALLISTYTLPARPQFVPPAFFLITPTAIGVQWSQQGNSTKTAYEVTYSTDSAFVLGLSTAIPFSAGFTGSSVTLSGLLTSLQYFIRVRAMNPFGQTTQYSFSTNTVTTNGGAAPGSLAGTLYANKNSYVAGNLGDGRAVAIASPPGAFPSDTTVTLTPFNVVAGTTLCPGGFNVAVTITDNPAFQPASPLYLTADFASTDIGSVPTSQIALERFDPSGVCVPLDTIFYPTSPRPTFRARINHFSQYQLVQIPLATSVGSARIFPNPFRASHDSYVTFDQMPPGTRVRVMTLRGETILDQLANSYGLINWTGTNASGRPVASGLYIVLIESGGAKKTLKLAVIR
ncbi:MAG: kelch repeat-containing protein [Elusimicrobiota bacterium]